VSTSVAFGPPRGDSSENVSVVRSRIPGTFTLRGTLGEPELAAQRLLDTAIAPPGSGKQSRLIEAFGEVRGSSEVYQFEYVVTLKDGRRLHNACAIFDKDSVLYTLTVLCPEDDWDAKSDKLLQVAGSFRKVYSGLLQKLLACFHVMQQRHAECVMSPLESLEPRGEMPGNEEMKLLCRRQTGSITCDGAEEESRYR